MDVRIEPFRFECTACGQCCRHQHGGATLYVDDVVRLAKFLDLTPAEFVARYARLQVHRGVRDGVPYEIADLRLRARAGKCVFLQGNLCGVHPAKPYLCRAAPLVTEVFADSAARALLAEICDGYGRGPMRTAAEIERWLARERRAERRDRQAYRSGRAARLGIGTLPKAPRRGRSPGALRGKT